MVSRSKWQYGILGVLMLATGAIGCGESGNATEEEATERPERYANVITTNVTPSPFTNYLDLVGEIEARQRVTVSIEEVGIINQILVKKGQRVKAGQVLAACQARQVVGLLCVGTVVQQKLPRAERVRDHDRHSGGRIPACDLHDDG